MKPNSGFVQAMLAMCSVTAIHLIQSSQINADHVRLMDQSMTGKVKSLILELASSADEKGESVTRLADEEEFTQANLGGITEEEAALIACIYGSCGRDVHITKDQITICPSRQVIVDRRRQEFKQKQGVV